MEIFLRGGWARSIFKEINFQTLKVHLNSFLKLVYARMPPKENLHTTASPRLAPSTQLRTTYLLKPGNTPPSALVLTNLFPNSLGEN